MTRYMRLLQLILLGAAALGLAVPAWAGPANFEANRIFIEYNQTDNDLGFHVFFDAEDWKSVDIYNPGGDQIFHVAGMGPYLGDPMTVGNLGLSELFTEGAEPSLCEVNLEDLLALFPEGRYTFNGMTTDGESLTATARLSHAVPAGPDITSVDVDVDTDHVQICWDPVTGSPQNQICPDGSMTHFPEETPGVHVEAYQVIVDPFQVTLPATNPPANMCVTLPPEFVQSLHNGEHGFEVLAIDRSGNQTITESSFDTP